MAGLEMIRQTSSLSSIVTDPLRAYKFHVEFLLPNITVPPTLGFMAISGLSVEISTIAYQQGGYNTSPQMMPSQATFEPVTFSRGVMPGDSPFLSWMNELFSLMQGANTNTTADFRAEVSIKLIDHPVTTAQANVKAIWTLHNAWPTKLIFGELNARGNDVLISQLTLRHEGWTFALVPGGIAPLTGD